MYVSEWFVKTNNYNSSSLHSISNYFLGKKRKSGKIQTTSNVCLRTHSFTSFETNIWQDINWDFVFTGALIIDRIFPWILFIMFQ